MLKIIKPNPNYNIENLSFIPFKNHPHYNIRPSPNFTLNLQVNIPSQFALLYFLYSTENF